MMALSELAYIQFGGFSVVAILGIITYAMMISAALTAILNGKGKISFDYRIHMSLGITSIVLATIHAILVLSGKFGW